MRIVGTKTAFTGPGINICRFRLDINALRSNNSDVLD